MHKYIGLLYDNPASLLVYLPADGLIIMEEMSRIQGTSTNLDTEEAEWYSSMLASNQMGKDSSFSCDWHNIWEKIQQPRLYMSVFLRHIPNTQPENIINFS